MMKWSCWTLENGTILCEKTIRETSKLINLDENESTSLAIKVIVLIVPVLLPFLHYCVYNFSRAMKGKRISNVMRMCSLHAYVGFFIWIVFLIFFFAFDLKIYGPSTMNFVYIVSLVFIPFNYLFVLIETCMSSESEYLLEKFENEDTASFISNICATKPIITFIMECYHIEIKTREIRYRDSRGNLRYRTETYTEKVTTWIGSEEFNFNYWKDTSDMSAIPVCDSNSVVKVKLKKKIDIRDAETRRTMHRQCEEFVKCNRYRDERYTVATTFGISNFKERILCYDRNYGLPFWMNGGCFWLASIMCLTWPYRLMLKRSSKKQNFEVVKVVSTTPFYENLERHGAEVDVNLDPLLSQSTAPPYFHLFHHYEEENLGEDFSPPSYEDVVSGRCMEMQSMV